jgi:hypothetical protein
MVSAGVTILLKEIRKILNFSRWFASVNISTDLSFYICGTGSSVSGKRNYTYFFRSSSATLHKAADNRA